MSPVAVKGHGPFPSTTERNHKSRPVYASNPIAAGGPAYACPSSIVAMVPAYACLSSIVAMGPGLCLSGFDHSYGPRPMHLRIQPPQWVPARAYLNIISVLGPGPCLDESYPCYASQSRHWLSPNLIAGPGLARDRVRLLQQVPAHSSTELGCCYRSRPLSPPYPITAMGPGPCTIRPQLLLWVPTRNMRNYTPLAGPGAWSARIQFVSCFASTAYANST